jgi:hypothetical protein
MQCLILSSCKWHAQAHTGAAAAPMNVVTFVFARNLGGYFN